MTRTSALVAAVSLFALGCPGPSTSTEIPVQDNPTPDPVADPEPVAPTPTAVDPMAPPARPHFAAKADVATFAPKCREGLERAKKQLPSLLGVSGDRNIENLLDPYNQMVMDLEDSDATAGLMRSVHPSEAIREAASKCEQDVAKFLTDLSLNRKLYEAFTKIDAKSLDADTRRLVDNTLRDFRRAGVDKDEKTRDRLKAIDKELVELGQKFGKNITEDVRHIELTGAKQLAGLPDDYKKAHAADKDGKIKITTNYPDYFPFMTYAESTPLRKKLYVMGRARGGLDNEKILKQILTLRAEKSKALGYKNWADYVTEDKMIKSGDKAAEFIERVVKTAQKRAQKDYKELLAYKKKSVKRARVVQNYEKSYLEHKVKAESYAFDSQSVRPYFPYAPTEQGLLDITSKIYDIQYAPVDKPDIWHQDVKAFDVVRSGKKLGRIYLDMHPREGKYKHAAQFTLKSGVKAKQLPEGVLVCNFPNPRTDGDALMEHGDVVTMFHEFGHLMHHILGGNQRWIEQSGVATEWDFVEAPSQMFEEWAWSHDTLKLFAKHHKTGAVIPKELVDRMRRADKFGIGVQTVQQMFYAAISLSFHKIAPDKLNMMTQLKKLQKKYTPFPYVKGTRFYSNFGHLNGYSAMYYTYMWSLVIAKDLLKPFTEHGLMNTEWTSKYRDKILGAGGTKDAADLVQDFLGREFNYKAFEEYLGS